MRNLLLYQYNGIGNSTCKFWQSDLHFTVSRKGKVPPIAGRASVWVDPEPCCTAIISQLAHPAGLERQDRFARRQSAGKQGKLVVAELMVGKAFRGAWFLFWQCSPLTYISVVALCGCTLHWDERETMFTLIVLCQHQIQAGRRRVRNVTSSILELPFP